MDSKRTELDTAASVEDVERILDELLAQEASVDAKLATLLDAASNQPDLSSLTSLQSTLHIQDQISNLNDRVGPAAETAHGLSERVKKLDIEQARIKESLKYVEDVQELKVHYPSPTVGT
jgi:flagellar biosynthesis chaperone FliJ